MNKVIVIMMIALLLLGACGKQKEESKNMEQLQSEQGIPVRHMEIKTSTFKQDLKYNAALSGKEESTAKAMVSDIVVSISAKVGDRVKKNQTIVSFPRNTPAAQFDQATTAFTTTRQAYERMQRLHAQGAISQQDLDNMEASFKVSKANLEASRKMIDVDAPIDGIVTNVMVNPADHVFPGADLFTVSNTSKYKALIWVPETDIKHVKKGTPARAIWNNMELRGRVTQIAMALDPNNKAFRVEVEFANTNREFAPGITAEIVLDTLSKANTIVVERQYVVREGEKHFAWVSVDGKAVKKEVRIGLDNKLEYEILSGLEPGEKLIVQGLNQLSDGIKILVIE